MVFLDTKVEDRQVETPYLIGRLFEFGAQS